MVLIAYTRWPIFKCEFLFPQNFFFPWVFLSFHKMGIHCAIVPFSLVLCSETMRQLITIWLLSTFTKFLVLSVERKGD